MAGLARVGLLMAGLAKDGLAKDGLPMAGLAKDDWKAGSSKEIAQPRVDLSRGEPHRLDFRRLSRVEQALHRPSTNRSASIRANKN